MCVGGRKRGTSRAGRAGLWLRDAHEQFNHTADSLELLSSWKLDFTVVDLEGNLKQICSLQLFRAQPESLSRFEMFLEIRMGAERGLSFLIAVHICP